MKGNIMRLRFRLVEEFNKIIAYNGSEKYFTKFSDASKGKTIETDNFDIPGVYFSSIKELARGYACGTTWSCYTDENGEMHEIERHNDKGYLYTCELNYSKPIIIDYQGKYASQNSDIEHKKASIIKNIDKYKSHGYDIVIERNIRYENPTTGKSSGIGNEYVVLDYNIIKILDIEEVHDELQIDKK